MRVAQTWLKLLKTQEPPFPRLLESPMQIPHTFNLKRLCGFLQGQVVWHSGGNHLRTGDLRHLRTYVTCALGINHLCTYLLPSSGVGPTPHATNEWVGVGGGGGGGGCSCPPYSVTLKR